ncbi:anaphase-promoting complex subunit 7-like [Phragmites australis]|uniref:anaphase-promoting complex subunit 7-like n=1 Tax=Phragmites australis TaxID=29695 RepID=UPI002D772D3B|nr:anaphase-promoting complex subunit 7-like [Phragmites australis]
MEAARESMAALLDAGLFGSAQTLGCFLVSSAGSSNEAGMSMKVESLVLHGDALYGEKEFRRALSAYKQAMQYSRSIPRQATSNSRSSVSTTGRSPSPNSLNLSSFNENEVKFKIVLCHSALREHREALQEMEGIPSKVRTLQMNLMLGKLYRIARNNRSATVCYKECLRQCPYIFEAITALAEIGLSSKEVSLLFSQAPNRGKPPGDSADALRWWNRYVEAQCCIASHDYKGGLDIYLELMQRFPNNVHILLEIAKVEAIIGRNDEAIMYFEKARLIDPNIITYMDEYAILLKSKSDYTKLSKLVHDMLHIDPARPETCVALAAMWERKDERKALTYAEKSLRVDDRHITGYIMKGNLHLSLNRPDLAVTDFRGAQELRADLLSYQGLVRAYLALSKCKEALFTAREAMKVMHQSAKALKLVGDVHAISSSGREKARKFYESAIRLEPGFLGAALALADLHVAEGRNKEAVLLLERYLRQWADDSLHIKLAQVFAATNMLSDALSHYQSALRINPHNEAAKKGLERLEKQMKGVDPDAPEEEDENEADDIDADQDDAELL